MLPMNAAEEKAVHAIGLLIAAARGARVLYLDCGCQLAAWLKKHVTDSPGFLDTLVAAYFPGVRMTIDTSAKNGQPIKISFASAGASSSSPGSSAASSSLSNAAGGGGGGSSHSGAPGGPVPHRVCGTWHQMVQEEGPPTEAATLSIAVPIVHSLCHVRRCQLRFGCRHVAHAGWGAERAEQVIWAALQSYPRARNMSLMAFLMHYKCCAAEHNLRIDRELPMSLLRAVVQARENLRREKSLLDKMEIPPLKDKDGNPRPGTLEEKVDGALADRLEATDALDAAAGHTKGKGVLDVLQLEARATALRRVLGEVAELEADEQLAAFLCAKAASKDVKDAFKGKARSKKEGTIEGATQVLSELDAEVARLKAAGLTSSNADVVFTERMVRLHAVAQAIRELRVKLDSKWVSEGTLRDSIYANLVNQRTEAQAHVAFIREIQQAVSDPEVRGWTIAADLHARVEEEGALPAKLGALTFAREDSAEDRFLDQFQVVRRCKEAMRYAVEDVKKALDNSAERIEKQRAQLSAAVAGGRHNLLHASGQSGILVPEAGGGRHFSLCVDDEATVESRPEALLAMRLYAGLCGLTEQQAQLQRLREGVALIGEMDSQTETLRAARKDSLARSHLQRDGGRLLRGELTAAEWVRRAFGYPSGAGDAGGAGSPSDRDEWDEEEEEEEDEDEEEDEEEEDAEDEHRQAAWEIVQLSRGQTATSPDGDEGDDDGEGDGDGEAGDAGDWDDDDHDERGEGDNDDHNDDKDNGEDDY
jgi:hypothetical protein